jgi:hypothetical protein
MSNDNIEWVVTHMPDECSKALAYFTEQNPRLNGAHWDDCLELLIDSDTHTTIIEPIIDRLDYTYNFGLVGAITCTLLWASHEFRGWTDDQRTIAVKATIDNNGGSK